MTVRIATESGVFDLDGHRLTPTPTRALAGEWSIGLDNTLLRNDRAAAPPPDGVTLNCLLPTETGLWVGTSEAGLYRLDGDRLDEDRAFANAPDRETWYTPWGGPPDVRSLAADADGTVFVNVHVGGILGQDAGGWVPTLDIEADVHQVVTTPDRPGTVLAACAWGLAMSSDGGDSFSFHEEGLHATYSRAVAVAGPVVILSASNGSEGRQAALYRVDLDGFQFERCVDGLPRWFTTNIDTGCLAVAGHSVFVGDRAGVVYRSDDLGATWMEAVTGLPRITALAG